MSGAPHRLRLLAPPLVALFLSACQGADPAANVSYNVTVVGAVSSRPLSFSGSYQFLREGKRVTRDFSGVGNVSEDFDADELVYVRVQGTNRDGIYSLKITRDGEVIYDSPATEANRPILYSTESGANR